jgi:Cof subfamily protein (haloacid dehalogenase superfamily)
MKLFVFDIDQTLIDDSVDETGAWVIYPEVLEAMNQLLRKGNAICLASGRNYNGCKLFFDRFESSPNVFCITANGAALFDRAGHLLYSKSVPYSCFLQMVACYPNHPNWSYLFYLENGTPGFIGKRNFAPIEAKSNASPLLDYNGKEVDPALPLEKAFINTGNDNAYEVPVDPRMKAYQAYATSPAFLEFVAKGVSKASATAVLAKRLGVLKRDVYSFGDGGNDIELVQNYHGTAMGNANPKVKAVAEYVTETAANRGVALALRDHWKEII